MEWIDITQAYEPGMRKYPSTADFEFEWLRSYEHGDGMALSRFTMTSHLGTHVDSPFHFDEKGARISDVPLEALCGHAWVLDLRGRACVEREDLAGIPGGCARVLFLTDNTRMLAEGGEFDNVYFTADACEELISCGVRLVGTDYFSVDARGDKTRAAHLPLLRAGVVILEGVQLEGVQAGPYELVCLPLKLKGLEAAPCRALLRSIEED